MAHNLFIFILMFILSINLISSSSQTTLQLSLTRHLPPSQQSNPETNRHPWMQTVNTLVSSSITRAHHLKNPSRKSSTSQIPLFALGYGGYSVSLRFGTPPQKLPFLMDTGSSPVWVPCTQRYSCSDCDFPNFNQTNTPKFIPKRSSSAKLLRCSDKKCGWFFGSEERSKCKSNNSCPAYDFSYALGSTAGLFLTETLDFGDGDVKDFVVGCSTISDHSPSGIVGFGRGPSSLPSQMGVKKFSYCLVSHQYDDEPVSSKLVLFRDSSNSGVEGLSYTKFHKMPENSKESFKKYYYVNLQKITVGGKTVKIPNRHLAPGPDGNGGTIIDSGTTYTFMVRPVYNLFAKEFENQMSKHKRAPDVESKTGLGPCFHIVGKPETAKYPELEFHFKGGANLSLPLADYFMLIDDGVLCMTFISSGFNLTGGPSIIIGNNQQQDIYFEYDLEQEKLGFKKQNCN